MAKLPTYVSQGQISKQEIGGRISPSVGGIVGNSVSNFGKTIADWGLAQKKAEEELAVLNAVSQAQDKFNKLGLTLDSNTIKTSEVPARFETGAQLINTEAGANLSSPYAKREFAQKYSQLKVRHGAAARTAARKRFIDEGIYSVQNGVANDIRSSGRIDKRTNPEGYKLAQESIRLKFEKAWKAGFYTLKDAGKALRNALSDTDEGQARMMIRTDPEGAALEITKKNFPYLNNLAFERIAKLAQGASEAAKNDRLRKEDKAEAKRERVLKENQETTTAKIAFQLMDQASGEDMGGDEPPSNSTILEMVSNRQITGDQAKELRNLREKLDEAETDDLELLLLLEDIDEISDMPQSQQEVAIEAAEKRMRALMSGGSLELNDAKTVRSVIKSIRDKSYKSSPKVVAQKWLKTALGGSDAEISVPGYKEDPSEKLRRVNALRQFHDRVYNGNEKPWDVAQDLFERSVNATNVKLSGFPRPKYGPEKNLTDYDANDINTARSMLMTKWVEAQADDYTGPRFGKVDFAQQLRDLNTMMGIILLKERQLRINNNKNPSSSSNSGGGSGSSVPKRVGAAIGG